MEKAANPFLYVGEEVMMKKCICLLWLLMAVCFCSPAGAETGLYFLSWDMDGDAVCYALEVTTEDGEVLYADDSVWQNEVIFPAEIIVAPYNDVEALRQLADRCDVLTYEFENVDAEGLDAVIKEGQLPQGTDLLRISQNRIFEKDFLSNKAQVTVAPYKVVTSSQELANIDLSKNYVLKTATGGYDGHGQKVIRSEEDLEEAYTLADSADCVLEEFVNFDLEISVIVSGNGKDVTVFPVQENIHRNNILSKTIVPARISASLADKAQAMAVRIAEQLKLSGTLCVEMFATADDIIVNEIAPRPHNSGHYSIEACDFSQFDTHTLGVLGAPLPSIHLHAPAVMLNVLGQHIEAAEKYVTENPSAHLHLYGKIEAKHNRKMGHVTLFSDVPDEVEEFGKGIDF